MLLNSIYKENSNKKINARIRQSINIPHTVFSSILVSKKQKREMIAEIKKNDVLDYIKRNKGATVNEVSRLFGIELDVTLLIFKKLNTEGKIDIRNE